MKYTVEGYSQTELLRLGLDNTDALLLRWFSDFFNGEMIHVTVDGEEYGWVSYEYVSRELPIISEAKDRIYRRFKAMVDKGILAHHYDASNHRAYYRPVGSSYGRLISDGLGKNTEKPRRNNREASVKIPYNSYPTDSSPMINKSARDDLRLDAVPRGSEEATELFGELKKNIR